MANKPSDYKYIELWGRECGYDNDTISKFQELAAQEGAPLNVAFKTARSDKPWYTTDDITDNRKRERIGLEPFTAETMPMGYLEQVYYATERRLLNTRTEFDRLHDVLMRRRAEAETGPT